ncbi:MAG: glycosyltransferase [Alphaproteobacteria bacterium]|nr:glycosyltransferase [Alphaproteobacteria bacterium]
MVEALTMPPPDASGGIRAALSGLASRHVLHVLPGFGVGGIQVRLARVINALGSRFRHTIISLNDDLSCRERLDSGVDVTVEEAPPQGSLLARLGANARRIRAAAPDVLATYNWGSIEWAMANQLLAGRRHYHFEDGFGPDEIDRPLRRRGVLRRLSLARADAVVVPSHTLEQIAVSRWHLPASRVIYLPNGVDLGAFSPASPEPPLFARRHDEIIVGTVAPLRPEKNLGRLLAAFARLDAPTARLVIAGEGRERPVLEAFAEALGIADRVRFLGAVREPQQAMAAFDIFTLSSDTEQMPMTVLEAMAAGLPIAAVDVGDIKHMVAPANRAFIVPRGEAMLATALAALVADAGRRHAVGRLNRVHVGGKYPFARMVDGYARLFEGRL